MWKPAERIRYRTKAGRWPSASEAARACLFSPYSRKSLQLSSRTWVPAMVPWRATDDGYVNDDVIAWYRRFAMGKPGAIVVEATGIRDVPSGPLLRIGDDRMIEGLKAIVEAVREASDGRTRLFIQLIDFLALKRRPDPDKYFERFLTPTDSHRRALEWPNASDDELRTRLASLSQEELAQILTRREFEDCFYGARERVTDMHLPHVRDLPQRLPDLFAAAAHRAECAGFDGVELHYAHAYTMASFLSALNTRDDGYGGAREQRLRLPMEVYTKVREAVAPNFVVGCRMLSEDCIDGGSELEDAKFFAREFAGAGFDFISLSRGGKFEDAKLPRVGDAVYPYTGPSGYECMPQYLSDKRGPFGRNVEPAAAIRQCVRDVGLDTPIVVAGGIHGFAQAEQILHAQQADIIGFARQALADPDWFEKVRRGYGDQVRLCEYTNYCEGLDQKHKQVTCQLWDRKALDDRSLSRSVDGRRRLVAPPWHP